MSGLWVTKASTPFRAKLSDETGELNRVSYRLGEPPAPLGVSRARQRRKSCGREDAGRRLFSAAFSDGAYAW
jgi:hypothetical protein